nr:hypothetical protein [Streptomyces sp. ISL-86]
MGKAVLPDGVTEGAGEGGQAAVEGGVTASGGELAGDEGGDVPVGELVQLEATERGDEVVADVVAVASHSGRLQHQGLRFQPRVEVGGDSLAGVGVVPADLAFEEPAQSLLGAVLGGKSAPADGGAVAWGGDIDGEVPGAVLAVGEQVGAVGAELVVLGVSAAAAAVDPAAAEAGTHRDRLREARAGVDASSVRPQATTMLSSGV